MHRPLAALATLIGALLVAASAGAQVPAPPKQAVAVGRGGAAATVDPLGTQAAIQTLRRGGNAVDAAVAAAATLGVAEPYSCGIGGGGFMVIYRAADRRIFTIDGREESPAAFPPTAFINPATGMPIAFAEAQTSGLGVGVPGTLRTWEEALDRFGTRPLRVLMQHGIRVAEQGFVVDQTFFDQTESNRDRFDDFATTRATFLTPGTFLSPPVGSVFRNPQLAATYRTIARRGVDAFYSGDIARAIVQSVRTPPVVPGTTRNIRSGVMTEADLAAYEALFRAPARSSYRGRDHYGMGPPSSGASTVGEALNILEGYPLSTLPRPQALHYFLEASAYSFADRGRYLGDPDHVFVPLAGLLSDSFAAERRTSIGPTASTKPVAPGDPTDNEGPSTTHLTVADRWGNVVSYTFTIESIGGSGIAAGDKGFLLNNELTDFEFTTGLANSPAGSKRPRSSMSPTIVLRDGRPDVALGSPGGSMIITTVLQTLVEHLDFGRSLPDAIATPRASQRNTATVSAEPAFISSPDGAALAALGHRYTTSAEIGATTGIDFQPGGVMQAAAEATRRGGGSAMAIGPRGDARACEIGARPDIVLAGTRRRVSIRLALSGMPAERVVVALRGAGVNRRVRTDADGSAALAVRPTRGGIIFVTLSRNPLCVTSVAVAPRERAAGAAGLTGRAR
ncbi:MAG TPA: gamma-glutamyltransferase [Gaiellaceae bacterium]|nr:gamma-glutamyltransferase [Gaiellaceae bacterium]